MEEILVDGIVQPEFVGYARDLQAFDVTMSQAIYQPSPPQIVTPPRRTIIYKKRPLRTDLTDTTLTFIEIMNTVMARLQGSWSFVGGFARDTYLGRQFNDYDVCVPGVTSIKHQMVEMGLLEISQQVDMEIPHDYYVDPYDFQKNRVPIHWIHAESEMAYAPEHFDFSINQIALKTDGHFHAPTQTWRDLDRGIIRKTADRTSANIAIRAIRFACRYQFTIEEVLDREIRAIADKPIDTVMLKRNLHKMIEDGVAEPCFQMMKDYGFPRILECTTVEEYIAIQDQLILSGEGYREPEQRGYF